MIATKAYEDVLRNLGREYFVFDIKFVDDLPSWARKAGVSLDGPLQPMKLSAGEGSRLTMFIQEFIAEETLDAMVNALGVRWSLKDNVSDLSERLNSDKKRLAYCFLKEYAKTVKDTAGDELLEDDWAFRAMEKLGFFNE